MLSKYFKEKNYDEGIEYIGEIKKKTNIAEEFIDTGNTALDAILNAKRSIAVSKGIDFITRLQVPEKMFVDSIDMCIIFGNAIDNAIEACDKVEEKNRYIRVSIIYDKNSLICKIANVVNLANIEKTGFLKTLKEDKKSHGYGIESIKSSLSKYNNVYRFSQKYNEFVFSFIIFSPINKIY